MRLGILVRGGLAIGRHFGDETIVFSEGLVNAYTLESTVARHPRIIVPDEFWDFVVANGYDEDIIWFRELYTWQDPSDGRLFIDYLNFMPFTRRDDPHHDGRDLRNHKNFVIGGLAAHRENPGILAKFKWLAAYHNQWCSDQYPTHPELLV